MSNKAGQDYWKREHASRRPHIAKRKDFIRRWIESQLARAGGEHKSCLEIGCYPGRFLAVFGELGYELYGVDLAERLEALPAWLRQRGYKTGQFWQQDFNAFDPRREFDVVASFGFIEHFTNWEDILRKHLSLVAAGGCLVVEAPNFTGGFQQWLHANFDRANYARHHIPAMDVDKWKTLIEDSGFDIRYSGYFGKFRFWTEQEPRTLYQRSVLRGLRILQPALRLCLPPDRKSYSPFCGVVATRR